MSIGKAAVAAQFWREAERRIEHFYGELLRLGETPPVARFRLEGFLEAGAMLDLASVEALQDLVDRRFQHVFGEPPARIAAAPGVGDPARDEALDGRYRAVVLPVRWRRAPVVPS